MSLFVFHEETADGIKERINWKPIILIAIALLAIGGVIGYLASRAGSDTTPTTTNPAPIQTPIQIPVQTTLAATNNPAPAGVIEITAEKLVRQFKPDPNGNAIAAYKKGTVFQVSGVFVPREEYPPTYKNEVWFSLGPAVKTSVGNIVVTFSVSLSEESELFKAFAAIKEAREVVVRGTYFTFDNSNESGVILKNVSLVSVAPAK